MKPSLAAPLAVLTTSAAWFLYVPRSTERLVQCERAWVVGTACAAGIALGFVLDSRWARSALSRWGLALTLLTPALAALVGASAAVPYLPRISDDEVLSHARDGFWIGMALLPALALFVAAARRASGARAGSVLWDVDGRTVWATAGTFVVIAATATFVHKVPHDHEVYAVRRDPMTLGFGAVAALGVAWMFIKNVLTLRELRTLAMEMPFMAPLEGDPVAPDAEHVDIGIGHQEVGRVETSVGPTYRARRLVELIVRGSPVEADIAMRRRLLFTAVLFSLTVAAIVMQLAVFGMFGARTV